LAKINRRATFKDKPDHEVSASMNTEENYFIIVIDNSSLNQLQNFTSNYDLVKSRVYQIEKIEL
jgi:hypothetical protein